MRDTFWIDSLALVVDNHGRLFISRDASRRPSPTRHRCAEVTKGEHATIVDFRQCEGAVPFATRVGETAGLERVTHYVVRSRD